MDTAKPNLLCFAEKARFCDLKVSMCFYENENLTFFRFLEPQNLAVLVKR